MRISTSIPKDKTRNFIAKLTKELSSNYSKSKIDMVEFINRKLKGWSHFYQFTDNTAMVYNKVDRAVFWKLGHWLARKYRCSMKSIMRKWCKHPEAGKAKTWVLFGRTDNGNLCGASLFRLVSSTKRPFRFRLPECNPYLRDDDRKTVTSKYGDVAMAVSHC
ncbi:group II intron maturase-specific domain-containing protein [Endozoicomonas acroporae]|uniref:group II intron maturase-specific domain-containing protein n=1 Tax=Endozoicomonas acroporae TaxID=1701104 RepID=UPI0013D4238E